VILLTMSVFRLEVGDEAKPNRISHTVSSRAQRGIFTSTSVSAGPSLRSGCQLSAHLRQRAQSANFHLEQLMLLRLVGERVAEERREWLARAQRRAQIDFVIAEQAGAKSSVSGQPHAIARRAVRVRHRRDDADRSTRAVPLIVGRGAISLCRP